MILDAHTHTHVGSLTVTTSAAELVAMMDANKVDQALVFAGRFNDCRNEILLDYLAPYAGRLQAVGSVSPLVEQQERDDQVREQRLEKLAAQLKNGQLVALKFYTGYEHFYPADACARPYLELCAQYGRPAIFHTGDCWTRAPEPSKLKYAHPLALDDLAAEMPRLKIVMAHCGNPWLVDGAEVVYNKPNVFADCSGFVCGQFDAVGKRRFVDKITDFLRYVESTDKLLFGSDWPISDQASYLEAMGLLKLRSEKLDRIMGGNAVELFGLNRSGGQ